MKREKEKVIFRVYPDGEVIALFPRIAVDLAGYNCQSYMHGGQHGAASPRIVCCQTKPASVTERANLRRELELKGYNIALAKRFIRQDQEFRNAI